MKSKEENGAAEKEEGARNFSTTLTQIEEGRLHAQCSGALHRALQELEGLALLKNGVVKGTVKLTLTLAVSPNGTVGVIGAVDTKLPKPPSAGSTFFLTEGGNLSVEHPRQRKLPLKEVPSPAPRDVPVAASTPRDV